MRGRSSRMFNVWSEPDLHYLAFDFQRKDKNALTSILSLRERRTTKSPGEGTRAVYKVPRSTSSRRRKFRRRAPSAPSRRWAEQAATDLLRRRSARVGPDNFDS